MKRGRTEERKETLKEKARFVGQRLSCDFDIPIEREEAIYELLPDLITEAETSYEILDEVIDMFKLETFRKLKTPMEEAERAWGEDFEKHVEEIVYKAARDDPDATAGLKYLGYDTPSRFFGVIRRHHYEYPISEDKLDELTKGTRYEAKPEKVVKPEIPLVEEIPEVPKISPEQEIYTKLDVLLRETLQGYKLAKEEIHDEAELWKRDLEHLAKEVVEGRRTQEDAEHWLKKQLALLEPIEEYKPPFFEPTRLEPTRGVVEVPRTLEAFTVPEGTPIMDIPYKEERKRIARMMLSYYWSEIVTYGLSSFFEAHPEFGVRHPTRELLNTFTEVAYEMAQLKYEGKHLYEWVISQAPAAKATIGLMLMEGVHGDRFQDWFINEHYPNHIREEARRIKPTITARGFMDTFKDGVVDLSL